VKSLGEHAQERRPRCYRGVSGLRAQGRRECVRSGPDNLRPRGRPPTARQQMRRQADRYAARMAYGVIGGSSPYATRLKCLGA
jgi:hypothetical protein